MTCRELANDCRTKLENQLPRLEKAVGALSDEDWNRPHPGGWSPAQIVEHLILSNRPYVEKIGVSLPSAPAGGDAPVKHTWIGRMILKMSGPSGNAPAPKPFVPGPGPFAREIFATWQEQQRQLLEFCRQAEGKNIGAAKVRNPVIKLAKMTLCDCFAIMADHTERHVVQIEERSARRA